MFPLGGIIADVCFLVHVSTSVSHVDYPIWVNKAFNIFCLTFKIG